MSAPIVIACTVSTVQALTGFQIIQMRARAMANNVQQHFRRASSAIQGRWNTLASSLRRNFSMVGAGAQALGAKLMELGASAREGAAGMGLMLAKYVALAAVAVHALPSIIDLLGVIQLMPAAILGAGLAMATFKLATHGIGDAISEALEDFNKWNKSANAKNMTRWTHDFVAGVVMVRDALKPLRKDLANRLFKELGADIVELTHAYLPTFSKWTKVIATDMNAAARAVGNWLKEPAQVAAIEGIFRNLASAIHHVNRLLKPLAQIFLDIATIGAPRLASMSETMANLADKAAAWVRAMKESGRLGEWLDKAMAGFTELRGIVADLVGVIGAMYGAADTGGKSFLETLHGMTTALKEWMQTAAGQEATKNLADLGKVIIQIGIWAVQAFIGVGYIVKAIYSAFNGLVKFILTVLSTILNAAAAAFSWIPGIGPKLDKAAKDFDKYRDRVNAALDGIKDETVNITFVERKAQGGTLGGSGGFRGLATGGLATGIRKVGEKGAELIDLGPRGGRVRNAGDTRQILSGQGSGGGQGGTIVVTLGGVGSNAGPVVAAMNTMMRTLLSGPLKLVTEDGKRVRAA